MVSRIKSRFIFQMVALGMLAAFHSNTAYAQSDAVISGGQICQPMANNAEGIAGRVSALLAFEWSAQGILNASDVNEWVVCPVVFSKLTNNFDVTVNITNRSDSPQNVLCVLSINNANGDPVDSEQLELEEPLPPSTVGVLGFVDFIALDTQSASVSCELPPGTGVTRIILDIL
jgi:hypothetical protein